MGSIPARVADAPVFSDPFKVGILRRGDDLDIVGGSYSSMRTPKLFSAIEKAYKLGFQDGAMEQARLDEMQRQLQVAAKNESTVSRMLANRMPRAIAAESMRLRKELNERTKKRIRAAVHKAVDKAIRRIAPPPPIEPIQALAPARVDNLSALPTIKFTEADRVGQPRISGIYWLLDGGHVNYVGQSVDLHSRVRSHRRSPICEWDHAAIAECPAEAMNDLEAIAIAIFAPRHNLSGGTHGHLRKHTREIRSVDAFFEFYRINFGAGL